MFDVCQTSDILFVWNALSFQTDDIENKMNQKHNLGMGVGRSF